MAISACHLCHCPSLHHHQLPGYRLVSSHVLSSICSQHRSPVCGFTPTSITLLLCSDSFFSFCAHVHWSPSSWVFWSQVLVRSVSSLPTWSPLARSTSLFSDMLGNSTSGPLNCYFSLKSSPSPYASVTISVTLPLSLCNTWHPNASLLVLLICLILPFSPYHVGRFPVSHRKHLTSHIIY